MPRFDTELTRPAHRIAGGVVQGALAWGAYALVEQTLSIWWPRLSGWDVVLTGTEWRSILAVLGLFVALGAVAGVLASGAREALAAAGLVPKVVAGARVRALASATVAAAFALNQVLVYPMGRAEFLNLTVGLGLTAALVLVACGRGDRWERRLGFVADPFLTSVLLLAGGWVGRHVLARMPAPLQLAGAVLALLLVGIAGAAATALGRRVARGSGGFRPLRAAAATAGLGLLSFGAAAVTGGRSVAAPPAGTHVQSERPNVVLIVMDTVRADHTSVGGYSRDTTPFLAELARQATVYTNAVAPGDMTLSSHASLFTGRYASWHGAHLAPPDFPLGRPLGPGLPTLAGVLASQGYRTMAVVANYGYLGPGFGLDHGFGVWEVRRHAIANDRTFLRTGVLKLMGGPWSSPELDVTFARAEAINNAALPLLREAAQDARPFFLFVNYMDAHEPYVPPVPFAAAFPGRDPGFHHDDYLALTAEVMDGSRAISPAERAHLISQYDGAIRYIDAQIAALATRLQQLGVWDRTMLVVTADHGEAFGERGLVGHGTSVYQDQVHVPLVIKYPRRAKAGRVVRQVSLVDVLPTVLGAAGLAAPKDVQGSPLESLDESAPHAVFSESFAHSGYRGRFERNERTIVDGGMKLIISTRGTREMYDLPADPGEGNELFRSDDPRAQALLAAIEGWIRAIPRTAPELPKLDRDTVRRLRALGYVN